MSYLSIFYLAQTPAQFVIDCCLFTAAFNLHNSFPSRAFFHADNGAFYYYNTERLTNGSHANYEQTLLDVHAYARSVGIPYKYSCPAFSIQP